MKPLLQPILILISLTVFGWAQDKRQTNEKRASSMVFKNISVLDMERGRFLPNQTVVVSGSRIAAIGSNKKVNVPPGALIVEGKDKFLVPGFADMHVHLYTEGDILTYLINGITTVRNMAGDATHLEFKRRIAKEEMIGPRIITAGPVLETGELSHPDNVLLTDTVSARREVKRQHKAGYDFVKVYNQMTPDVYRAVVAAAREFKMQVVGHVPLEVGLDGALAARQDSIEHFRGYIQSLVPRSAPVQPTGSFRNRSVAWNYIDDSRIDELVKRTVAAGVWNCPTFVFSVHELSPIVEHNRLLARPEVRLLSLTGAPDRTKNDGYLSNFTESDFAATQQGLNAQFRLLRALDKAGAGLLVGTDSWLNGYAITDEFEMLVKAGLTPARVLRMATVDAARFLGESSEWGTITVGRRADLVLLDADPLANIANTRRIRALVNNGRLFRREELDALLSTLPIPKRGK